MLATLAATGTALWPLWPVYDHPSFLIAVGGGALAGVLVALLGAIVRWKALGSAAAAFGVFLLLGVPLAVPGRAIGGVFPSTQGLIELLAGLALSWKQLLTIALPVGPYQALLVPAFVLALGCAIVSATIALRGPHAELAAIAPVVVFVAAILLGPTAAILPIENALLLFVVSLLWVLFARFSRRRMLSRSGPRAGSQPRSGLRMLSARALFVGALTLSASLVLGTAATVLVPPSQAREVLRSDIRQPFEPRDFSSPLASFRANMREPRADDVLLSVTGLPDRVKLRLASLDRYDGIVYSVGDSVSSSASDDFTRLPYRLDQSHSEGERLRISVELGDLGGVWVPGVGPLESMSFGGERSNVLDDAFYYNDAGATGAVLPGLRPGDRYESVGIAVPEIAANRIAELRPGPAALPEIGMSIDAVSDTLERWTKAGDEAGSALANAIAGLMREGYISHGVGADEPPSRSGHGADRITELLTSDPMIGDGEQYAVAAAVLAREIGFPARVVIGFSPSDPHSADTSVEIRGSDTAAWIEVHDAKLGWVAIDPNPPVREIPEQKPDDPLEISRPQSVVPPPVQDRLEDRDPPAPDSTEEEDDPVADPFLHMILAALSVAAWTLLGLAIAATPFFAVIIAKLRRRRKRRGAAHPLARIEGGWLELADSAADSGITVPLLATRSEQAKAMWPSVEDSPGASNDPSTARDAAMLAILIDRASFAPEAPSRQLADEAWASVDALRGEMGSGRTRWQRLRSLVSLRSFTRYAGGAKEGTR